MQSFERFWKAFIITHQTTETGQPAKEALNDPAAGQEHKAFLGVGQLDNHQADALLGGGLFGFIPRIALIDKDDVHRLASGLLHCLGQGGNLRPILLIGGSHIQRQQVAQRIDRHGRLLPLRRLAPS